MQMYTKAKEHMTALMKSERKAAPPQPTSPKVYEVGNLTLFLVGDMSTAVSGAVVEVEAIS